MSEIDKDKLIKKRWWKSHMDWIHLNFWIGDSPRNGDRLKYGDLPLIVTIRGLLIVPDMGIILKIMIVLRLPTAICML